MSTDNRDQLTQRLLADAGHLGVALTDMQLARLVEFLFQLERWNKTYNLTAIRDIEAMRVQHLVDSLAVVPALVQVLDGSPRDRAADHADAGAGTSLAEARDQDCIRLMDVGSGAGLPGVVLAIVRSDWMVTCVDAVEKKTAFVRHVASLLKLPNLDVRHARVERLAPQECDAVISRAFASLDEFAELAGRHVKHDGMLVAMKGKYPHEEIDALHAHTAWKVLRTERLVVPGLDAERCVVFMQRA